MRENFPKIAHVTTVHPRDDIRIFKKMCCSLAEQGFDTTLIVADGKGGDQVDGVKVIDIAPSTPATSRIKRMYFSVFQTFKGVKKIDADVYHLHDPELIPVGLMLRAKGKKVIFDAHEDLPKQILTKAYLNPTVAKFIALIVLLGEKFAFRFFSGLVGATQAITKKLAKSNNNAHEINNFAIIGELATEERSEEPKRDLIFVGGMTSIRGIEQIVEASAKFKGKLHLVGEFGPAQFEQELKQKYSFDNIVLHGFLGRKQVAELMSQCAAGFVTYLPCPNHIEAQPNKLFEYMSASLPVIASDYPLWREIVIDNNCGICVDPESVESIVEAVDKIVDSQQLQVELGKNGQKAVKQKYNWQSESKKLINIYKEML